MEKIPEDRRPLEPMGAERYPNTATDDSRGRYDNAPDRCGRPIDVSSQELERARGMSTARPLLKCGIV